MSAQINNLPPAQEPMRGWHFILFNLSLGLGHFLVLFNAGAYLAMFPHIAGGLAVNPSHITWTQTDYFISMALAFPIANWLAARLGEVRLFVLSFLMIALSSLLSALTSDLHLFLIARILQGFFGGISIPLSLAILLRQYSEADKPLAISLWSIATLTPFTLAPAAGGWVADNLGWRWLFYLNVPMALAAGLITAALLYGRESTYTWRSLDKVGYLLLVLVAGCIQTVLNEGQDADWTGSPRIIFLMLLGAAAAVYFIIWELGEVDPVIDIRLFMSRNYSIGAFSLFLGFMFFQGLLSLYLLKLQFSFGYTSFLAGLALVPMAVFAKPVASFFHRVAHRFDARLLASMNFLGFAAACYWVSTYDRTVDFTDLLWPQMLAGVFLGGFFVPLTVIFLSGLEPARHPRAVELSTLLRVAGGSFGIPLIATLWLRRSVVHQKYLVENVTPFNPALHQAVDVLHAHGMSPAAIQLKLDRMLMQHAAMLSFNEMFWVGSWVFLGLSALVLLARPSLSSGRDETRERALEDLVEEP